MLLSEIDVVRRGTWIVNVSKHLNSVRASAAELDYFEAFFQAGKAGNLLARMAADSNEILSRDKVMAFARSAHVRSTELNHCLELLKRQERVDFTTDSDGKIQNVEVYSFSTRDALTTTAQVFDRLDSTPHERSTLVALEKTFYLPHTQDQMLSVIHGAGCEDKDAQLTLELGGVLGLVKVSGNGQDKLYYNEYAFNNEPELISRALSGLSIERINDIKAVQDLLEKSPGFPLAELERKVSPITIEMMEGVGLLDAMPVRSPNGQAVFVTIPQLRGIALDRPTISADVFHKAKTLLNSLRYGQYFSSAGRGKIVDDSMLVNIVKKLVGGDELRPSTAAGQDYKILELEGVISTRPFQGSMHTMSLRQSEVGQVVLQMLEYHSAMPEFDMQGTDGGLPTSYEIPEKRRSDILTHNTIGLEPAIETLLHAVRTGERK